MIRKKGFTLVEMMVVILIVAILATAAVPILRGQIDKAKWAEGKSFMGLIASSIRAYMALNDPSHPDPIKWPFGVTGLDDDLITYEKLGFVLSDFDGKYFTAGSFNWDVNYNRASDALTYTVRGFNTGTTITYPVIVELNESGEWTEL